MLNQWKIRRPISALIAGSALLLGGAAMPKFSLHNPTLLYVLGEARLAVGDHDGGLRLIGSAASQKEKATDSVKSLEASKTSAPAKSAAPAPTMCRESGAKPAKGVSKAHVSMSSFRHFEGASSEDLVQLAKLERANFAGVPFDEAQFQSAMRQAAQDRAAAQNEQVRTTLTHVRAELQRHGIAVPPAVPAPPLAVAVIP
jgi:hypothetical protein